MVNDDPSRRAFRGSIPREIADDLDTPGRIAASRLFWFVLHRCDFLPQQNLISKLIYLIRSKSKQEIAVEEER